MSPLTALRSSLGEKLSMPGSPGYRDATDVSFAAPGRTPLAAVRPTTTAEVAAAVRQIRDSGLPLAVRGGGHTLRGVVDGAVTLDMRALSHVEVDPGLGIGVAGGGTLAGDYLAVTHQHGVTTGFGDAPTVGVAGITLGGGVGFLTRRDGLSLDNLRAAEVVLADGRVVVASDDEHADLFWALRGGGGNFGVVTKLRFGLRPTSIVTGGLMGYRPTPEMLTAAVQTVLDAPRELGAVLNLVVAPPLPWLPVELHGEPLLMIFLCHSGHLGDAPAVLEPFRHVGEPVLDTVSQKPYPDMIEGPPAAPVKMHPALGSGFVDEITPSWAAAAIDAVKSSVTELASIQLRPLGGAVAEVSQRATAFAHRQRNVTVAVVAATAEAARADAGESWVKETGNALGLTGRYVNFLSDNTSGEDVAGAYPADTLSLLRAVKKTYDPDNTFFSNLNISPA